MTAYIEYSFEAWSTGASGYLLKPITATNLRNLMKNKDSLKRKEIRESYSSTLEQYGATSAQLLNSYVALSETVSKIKKYDNSY